MNAPFIPPVPFAPMPMPPSEIMAWAIANPHLLTTDEYTVLARAVHGFADDDE